MEADWEIEVGGDAPVIEAHWAGFVDLRTRPDRARSLAEDEQLPGLAEVLVRLNAPQSPVWTSKCDVWRVSDFDPYELDGSAELPLRAIACYIDILPRSEESRLYMDKTKGACRAICARLRAVPFRSCRVDLIVRHANIAVDRNELGITAYLTACGVTEADANSVLIRALFVFAETVETALSIGCAGPKLQWIQTGE